MNEQEIYKKSLDKDKLINFVFLCGLMDLTTKDTKVVRKFHEAMLNQV